ncbi:sulfatase [Maioricimonas rarisocia]|nr:sulfatase [Maioricimonas rarisocia]
MHARRSAIRCLWACSLLALLLIAGLPGTLAAEDRPQERPNILFILADDLGWSDLGCYGATLCETPRLDRLAEEGMKFTSAYSPAPICSASRASILTGRSPARLQFEFVTKPQGVSPPVRSLQPPPYTRDLPLEEVTLAESLRDTDYVSAFSGKWHVTEHYGRYLGWSPEKGPQQQGFDVAIETFGSHTYAGKRSEEERSRYAVGEFPVDDVTGNAIRFMKQHRDGPFLMYVSHYFVHTPVRAPTTWLHEKYRDEAADRPGDPERRAHYAAFVETLDRYVGQLLDALDQLGLRENTLVVFTSDNGGHPEYADNAPLRGSKWNLYEGGIRVPMIVRWPGHVAAGTTCDVPVTGTDLFATFRDVAGLPTADQALDGESLLPLFEGREDAMASRDVVWHFPYYHPEKGYEDAQVGIGINDFAVSRTTPQSAIRAGRYKLIHFYDDDRDELYDLANDLGEQHDLSGEQPQRARELRQRLDAALLEMQARMPVPADAVRP